MISLILRRARPAALAVLAAAVPAVPNAADTLAVPASAAPVASQAPAGAPHRVPTTCLPSGDGYLRARIAGAIDADIDWPNSGTVCAGEPKREPAGVRMSFRRTGGDRPHLVFVFGLTGVREGRSLREGRANLTVIDESDGRFYGTLGDRRCTIDSLSQRRLAAAHTYRVEARGFCTQPARAVRGAGDVLVSRFDFAGEVNYGVR